MTSEERAQKFHTDLNYEQSLLFLQSVEQNARHANGHARDWWRKTGEARKKRITNQPIIFCVVRPTLNSLALAKRAVSLFSSRAAALVSRVSRLRRSRARALLSLNLKKKRDCSQSNTDHASLPRSGFWLVVQHGKFDSTNQKHFPDLGGDVS